MTTTDPGESRAHPFRRWVAWITRPRLCFGGLAVGLVCFWLSLTPSLLPRSWVAQGIVSGVSLVCGYGIGSGISALVRSTPAPELSEAIKRGAWWILGVAAVAGSAWMLWQLADWQDELSELVGVDPVGAPGRFGLVVVSVVVAMVVLVISRVVRSAARFLIRQVERLLPRRVAIVVGLAALVLMVVGLAQGVLWRAFVSTMNSTFSVVDEGTRDYASQPTTRVRSGDPDSLTPWDTLGRMGRSFVGRGPTQADLEDFHGAGCCEDPIRVYVGLESGNSPRYRAALAVRELERTGAFDREVLGVFTSTGTGWINPNVSDALEYIHRGDTAEVSMQYSYLPSWISVLVDEQKAGDASRELVGAVRRHLDGMPAADRPQLYLFGESLGSFGMENGLGDVETMQDVSDGVMLIGPTYDNPVRQRLTEDRVPGSPEWRPEILSPAGVHFAMAPSDLEGVAELPGPKVIYLQNASDPVTWWNPSLLYSKPDWAGPPAAPDRSPSFRWMPVVTFWQVVGDLPVAGEVPGGHGHIFGSNVVDGWLAVDTPDGWTAEQTARLRALMDDEHG